MDEMWRESSHAVYREGWLLLGRLAPSNSDEIAFLLEELREILLDLKQSVIAGDAEYAVQYQNEAVQLMVQIKLEEEGGV